MEPERNPLDPQLNELDGILREAFNQVRRSRGPAAAHRDPVPPSPSEERPAAAEPSVRFEAEHRRRIDTPRALDRFRIVWSPALTTAVVMGSLAAILWLPVLTGAWSSRAAPLDPAYENASLRVAMALTAERIDDFAKAHHGAPATLAETGNQPWDGFRYDRIANDRYRLTAASSAGPIVLDSMLPRDRFLGRSRETLHLDGALLAP